MTKRAFAIAAHPDDIEFVMSGTMMLLREAGYELHYMNIADGSCGTTQYDAETIVRMREEEARRAAAFLGATFHKSLTSDIGIFYDRPTIAKVASVMREVAPEILLVHSPQDYMEDHMNASRLAVTAAFTRGMPNFPVDPPQPTVDHEVTIYHAQPHGNCDQLRQPVVPELYVDVSSVMDQKQAMLAMHASQKAWLDESQGMNSYVNTMVDLTRRVGKLSGRLEFAEGWRRHSHLGLCGEETDPLSDALGALVLRQQTIMPLSQ